MVDENETPEAASDDAEIDEGRPRDPDEVDPELVSLARPRGSVGPLLSLSIVVFCVYIIVRLLPDFSFSRQGDTPRQISNPGEIADEDGASSEEFVVLRAVPDQSFVAHLSGTHARYGHRIAPVLGSNAELWLLEEDTPWASESVHSQLQVGRLRRLDDLPFADGLRQYVREQPPGMRFVPDTAVKEALSAGRDSVIDAFGDRIAVTAETPVTISEVVLDQARIEAFRASLKDEESARAALVAAGLLTGAEKPTTTTKEMFVYVVPAPAGLEAIRTQLVAAKQFGARAEPVRRSHETTWSALGATSDALTISETSSIPWLHISSIAVTVPRAVPADAMVLLTGERPGSFWYLIPLYVVLGVFVLLFLWALVQYFRHDAGKRAPSPAEDASS